MIYKDFKGLRLSALGLGMMRLPVVDGDDKQIDEAAVCEMVDYALEHGINYFDTAHMYHGGNSELAVGRTLVARHPRESFFLATKFPGFDDKSVEQKEEIFEKQLRKCQTGYFDFYLFHNVCGSSLDRYMSPKFGLYDYLMQQKAEGRIKHLGFSCHASVDEMRRFLDAYRDGLEFCQIQLNYLDWTLQDAKAKVELLREYNIPVWVMEPVRGGRLAKLGESHTARLNALRPDEGIPAWAFRFLQTVGVTMTLSGMSNMDQLRDNIHTFETLKPLNEKEMAELLDVAAEILGKKALPCTACRYCTEHCPKGLDIPEIIKLYNEASFTGEGFVIPSGIAGVPEEKLPSACVACKSCEKVCPQQIKVSEMMKDFAEKLKG